MINVALLLLLAVSAACTTYSYTFHSEHGECAVVGLEFGRQESPLDCARAAGGAGCAAFMHSSALSSCSCCAVVDPSRNASYVQQLFDIYDVLDCSDFAEQPLGEAHGALSNAVLTAYYRLWNRAKSYLHC